MNAQSLQASIDTDQIEAKEPQKVEKQGFGSTPEVRAKALAARKRLKIERTSINLLGLLDFPIDRTQAWERLARERKITMPGWDEKITTPRILAYLRKIGVSRLDCAEWLGDAKGKFPGAFAANNPKWPLYALVGTVLENVTAGDAVTYA